METSIDANSIGREISLSISGLWSSVLISAQPSYGTLTINGSQAFYRPAQGYSGTDSFRYTATGFYGTSVEATVTIHVISNGLTFPSQTLPEGTVFSSYHAVLFAASGGAPYRFTVTSGSLPAGLSLATDGTISGTPTTAESQTLTIAATDIYGATGSQVYTITVAAAAPVAGDVMTTVAANTSNNPITLDLSGGAASSVAVASGPSHGNAVVSATAITYTPTPGYSGADSFTYTATNASGESSPATVNIAVTAPNLALSPTGRITLRQNEPISQAFSASNGSAPYSYALTGSLPAGVSFNAASATLSGTPAEHGEFPLTLTAHDVYGATGSTNIVLAIEVAAPVAPSISSASTSGLTTTVDLTDGATGGPFTGADLISLSPPSAGIATIILDDTATTDSGVAFAAAIGAGRYRLRFTVSPTFSGTAVATYTLTSSSGTSAPATITFSVSARPDLAVDADLVGLLLAQAEAARRLADNQIDNVEEHLKSLRGRRCLENSLAVSLTDGSQGQAPASANAGCSLLAGGDLAFWSGGSITFGNASTTEAGNIDYATASLSLGLDYRLTENVIGGIAIGFSQDRSDVVGQGTASANKAASATLYGIYQPGGGLFLEGLVGTGLLTFESLRTTSVTGRQAEANRSGRQVYAAITGGYDYRIDDVFISSYGRFSGSHSLLDKVEESSAGWENAVIGSQNADGLTATFGLTLGYDIALETAILTPELTLDFSHDFMRDGDTIVTYADSGWPIDYVVAGSSHNRDRLTVGFGLTLATSDAGTMTARYSATLDHDGLQSQRINIDLSKRF
ncbi:autotransporter domain-containing protein [Rhizobium sp. AC44/96]|uniref:autotransporter domain-containing protein n=1 Tax=Rhizobium sp. AC44/96 TaxID=1841654 RepID=UPI0009F53D98|nr:autotransporter domain-containing protein [Rhizobium sp. AC44/96]